MAINNPKFRAEFNKIFNSFQETYSKLEKLVEDKGLQERNKIIPKFLRLFRVRLLLVIGLKISFDTTYSLTTEEKIEKTYIQILKCCEAWFAYEGLVKLANADEKSDEVRFARISQTTFDEKYKTSKILRIYNDELRQWIGEERSKKREEQLKLYLTKLEAVMDVRAQFLKQCLKDFIVKIDGENDINHYNVLAMIYATRNVFVHKGESAHFGEIIYKHKHDMLELAYEYIILIMLKALEYYCDKQLFLNK